MYKNDLKSVIFIYLIKKKVKSYCNKNYFSIRVNLVLILFFLQNNNSSTAQLNFFNLSKFGF